MILFVVFLLTIQLSQTEFLPEVKSDAYGLGTSCLWIFILFLIRNRFLWLLTALASLGLIFLWFFIISETRRSVATLTFLPATNKWALGDCITDNCAHDDTTVVLCTLRSIVFIDKGWLLLSKLGTFRKHRYSCRGDHWNIAILTKTAGFYARTWLKSDLQDLHFRRKTIRWNSVTISPTVLRFYRLYVTLVHHFLLYSLNQLFHTVSCSLVLFALFVPIWDRAAHSNSL